MDVSVTSEVFNIPPQEDRLGQPGMSGTAMEIPTRARDDEPQDARQIGTRTRPPNAFILFQNSFIRNSFGPLVDRSERGCRISDDLPSQLIQGTSLPIDVRQIEPATSPPDPVLLGEPHLPLSPSFYSLLELLEKIYQDYAGITRIRKDCHRLGSYIDFDQLVLQDNAGAQEMQDLQTWCKRLDYLFRTGRSSPRNRARIEQLLANIKLSSALRDVELLRGRKDLTELYFKFCELTVLGESTGETIRALRRLVQEEIDLANLRLEQFDTVRKQYEDGGRHELASLMQNNVNAARKAGFKEGVGSAEESSQIQDELDKIDKGLAKIGETLRESKDFWQGVDRKLASVSLAFASQQAKDPPDGITTGPEASPELRIERHAGKIHAGLQTVHQAAKQRSNSKKIRKAGDRILKDAADLTKKCTGVVHAQTSVEIHLFGPTCNQKSGRTVLSPLTKGLGNLVSGYQKLSLRFTKWAEMVYLLFWFAGTTDDKMHTDRPDHLQVAQAELLAKGLFSSSYSSYALPFETTFMCVDVRLHAMRKFWTEVLVRVDSV
ncbi:hypothetical protein B0H13DRAFT_2670024 [Mycena leptocephala]|nr:hypothetical protein B0H13DRAFT_2670024 [Mycena leptocephala]